MKSDSYIDSQDLECLSTELSSETDLTQFHVIIPTLAQREKPLGFHGRMYYEDGPPQFKYQGRKKDEAYWLEREPYLPVMEERRLLSTKRNYESYRGINPEKLGLSVDAQGSPFCGCASNYAGVSKVNEPSSRFVRSTSIDGIKRQTQDGVGLF